MTDEERAQRDAYLRDAMPWANAAPKPSLETRLGWLEADASAQRTAILQVERRVVMLAGAVVLAGIVAVGFKIAMEVLT